MVTPPTSTALCSTDVRPVLELIPPMSPEFSVYGGSEIVERARKWALYGRYLLARGVPACAHGLYMMDTCPNGAVRCCDAFDHTDLWVPDRSAGLRADGNGLTREPGRPFLLTSPHILDLPALQSYAQAHGLQIGDYGELDGWYGYGTHPIRLELPLSWPMWPIEREAEPLFSASPVSWPPDPEDGGWVRHILEEN